MFGDLGLLALLFSMCLLMLDLIYRCVDYYVDDHGHTRPCLYGYASYACLLSIVILIMCFLGNDFGLRYVYFNSSLLLPLWFKISAFWSSHEGSWLLWLMISLFNAALLHRQIDERKLSDFDYFPLSLSLLLYACFQVVTSNPFTRILPIAPGDGLDMNPLLQDYTFTIHPPCLYMGLCAMIVPYAIACNLNASDSSRFDQLIDLMRPWLYWSWGWLTLGITLGSFWAYRELGWGGWWFWDPVENAAFMPWCLMTILMHLLHDVKSQISIMYIRFYCIVAYVLTLLGTWITRSGAFVTVHGFTTSEQRSYFLLAMAVLAFFAPYLTSWFKKSKLCVIEPVDSTHTQHWLWWHFMSISSVCFAVCIGVFAPFLYQALGFHKISVTLHYYVTSVQPLMVLVILSMLYFVSPSVNIFRMGAVYLSISTIVLFMTLLYFSNLTGHTLDSVQCFYWIFLLLLLYAVVTSLSNFTAHGYQTVTLAHGLIYFLSFCVIINHCYSVDRLLHFHRTVSYQDDLFSITLVPKERRDHANHQAQTIATVLNYNHREMLLNPELRHYKLRAINKSVADVKHWLLYDILVSVTQVDRDHYVMRLYVKPLQSFFWLSGTILALLALYRALVLFYRHDMGEYND